MNFFKTVILLCKGPAAAEKCFSSSPVRAILHLLILMLLCSVAAGAAFKLHEGEKMASTGKRLFEKVGAFTLSENNLATTVAPEKQKSYVLSKGVLRLDYMPGKTMLASDVDKWDELSGIIITNGGLAVWNNVSPSGSAEKKYNVVAVPVKTFFKVYCEKDVSEVDNLYDGRYVNVSPEKTEKVLKEKLLSAGNEASSGEKEEEKIFSVTENDVVPYAVKLMTLVAGMAFFGEALFSALFSILFFAIAQKIRFSGAAAIPGIKFSNIFVVTCYAAFVPLIIATLFNLAGVHLVSFQMVFFTAFFIYHILSFNALLRKYAPRPKDDFKDDEF